MGDERYTQAQLDEAVDKARTESQAEAEKAKGELLNAQNQVAELEKAGGAKDAQIAELTTQVTTVTGERDALTTERDTLKGEVDPLKTSLGTALEKYRALAISANPDVPEELIKGANVDELAQAVESGRAMVAKVRDSISKQLATTQVPPGAPVRPGGTPDLANMTPMDKIKYGIANPPKS